MYNIFYLQTYTCWILADLNQLINNDQIVNIINHTSNQTYNTYSMIPAIDNLETVILAPKNQMLEKNQQESLRLKNFKSIN